MHHKEPGPVLCRSVFRSGEDAPTTERMTQVWASLISQMEQSKGMITVGR